MIRLRENALTFVFGESIDAQKYDEWTHYKDVWNRSPARKKAVDFVAVQALADQATLWMIEVKDYRKIDSPPRRANLTELHKTIAAKVRDTLSGLSDAALHASRETEKELARKTQGVSTKRIVLHLEPHIGPHSVLFPSGFSASVLQRLKQMEEVQAVDRHPLVLNLNSTQAARVPWRVEDSP